MNFACNQLKINIIQGSNARILFGQPDGFEEGACVQGTPALLKPIGSVMIGFDLHDQFTRNTGLKPSGASVEDGSKSFRFSVSTT